MALLYLESGVCMLFHLSLEWFIHIPSVAQLLAVGTAVNIEFTPSIFSLFLVEHLTLGNINLLFFHLSLRLEV